MSHNSFLQEHVEQIDRLMKQRSILLSSFVTNRSNLRSLERRLLLHLYSLALTVETSSKKEDVIDCLSDKCVEALLLFNALYKKETIEGWIKTKLNEATKHAETIMDSLSLFPELVNSSMIEGLMNDFPEQRDVLWKISSAFDCSISSACVNRSIHASSWSERTSVFDYALYRTQFNHVFNVNLQESIIHNEIQNNLNINVLTSKLKGRLLRGDSRVVDALLDLISHIDSVSEYNNLFKLLAHTGDNRGLPVLQKYCETNPKKGPWLLAIHGTSGAIECLIDNLSKPAMALSSVTAWHWLTGFKLPYSDNILSQIVTNAIQVPYEANQHAAKIWWYSVKPQWPLTQRMWQGKIRTSRRLLKTLSDVAGTITKDLWDMYLVESGNLQSLPFQIRIQYQSELLNQKLANVEQAA
jgi:hypothetical protein